MFEYKQTELYDKSYSNIQTAWDFLEFHSKK